VGGVSALLGKELVEAGPDLYELAETAVTDPEILMEVIKESVPRKAEGGLLEAPVLYAAKGKVVKKKAKAAAQKVKKKKKAKKETKTKEEPKKETKTKETKESEIGAGPDTRSRWRKYQDWRSGKPWYSPSRHLLPGSPSWWLTVPGAAAWGLSQRDKSAKEKRTQEAIQAAIESQRDAAATADAQAEREATTAEKRRRNRALIAAGREMMKYTEGHVPYNWLSDAATAYSDTMAGKDQPELIQTAYAMMAENPELKFEDALRSVLSRGAVEAVDPQLKEIQLIQQIPGMEEYAEFLMQNYALSKLSPEALEALPDVTEIE
jgi:hypothetical protein